MTEPGKPLCLADIAAELDLPAPADGDRPIDGVATLASAGPEQISFLANSNYASQLAGTRAGAVILRAEYAENSPVTALVVEDPYLSYARIAALFQPKVPAEPGIHPSAVISTGARVHATASVGPCCVIEDDAVVEAGAIIGAHCHIGPGCRIGEGSRLIARVTLVTRVKLGRRVLVHPGAVIGSDGFGQVMNGDSWLKVPQLGGVCIGDDCEIGANTTIDRGAIEDTVLEEDVRLDNQIQIAHNVMIGAHTAMAGCSAIAGSARIGRYCQIGGSAGILGHLSVADHVTITAMSLVSHSIREPGEYSGSLPLQKNREWRRNAARLRRLDAMAKRLAKLEKDSHHD